MTDLTPEELRDVERFIRRTNPQSIPALSASPHHHKRAAPVLLRAAFNVRHLLTILIVAASGVLWFNFAATSSSVAPMPHALIGTWHTLFPGYEGATMDFTPTTLTIGAANQTGAAKSPMMERYRIAGLAIVPFGDRLNISLTYHTQDGPTELLATLDTSGQPRLHFARPPGLVWERASASTANGSHVPVTTPSPP